MQGSCLILEQKKMKCRTHTYLFKRLVFQTNLTDLKLAEISLNFIDDSNIHSNRKFTGLDGC